MATTLLLDTDVVAVRAALFCQAKFDFGEGEFIEYHPDELPEYIDGEIQSYRERTGIEDVVCALSSDTNFRKGILPTYKAKRPPKPKLVKDAKQYILDNYDTKVKPGLEGDDVLGILSTHPKLIKGDKIIVSIDKDMKTIPGLLFNPDHDEGVVEISELQADRYWLYQTLVGDTIDEYKGCPGIGEVRATQLLDEVLDWGTPWATNQQLVKEAWERIVKLFESKGLTQEDALTQARVARICRHTDYDFKAQQVKLWTPPVS